MSVTETFENKSIRSQQKKLYDKRTHEIPNRFLKTTEKASLINQKMKKRKNKFKKKAKKLIET